MKILVACEFSGRVRDAFRARGHAAWSCDILLCARGPSTHLQMDVFQALDLKWDMLIAFPPCTYLCSSGLHWCRKFEWRAKKREEALEFVRKLMDASVERIAIENPVGCISTRIRKPDQIIQPYEYGDDASKKTCLWLKGLPKLKPMAGDYVQPRLVDGKNIWSNQTPTGQSKLSSARSRERSITFQGIARAMAAQWSSYGP